MRSGKWLKGLRELDLRLLAAIGATLLLIFAIVFTLPKAPDSSNMTFDAPPRHDISHAEPIEVDKAIESRITGQNDADFYQVKLASVRSYLHVYINNESQTLIPALRVYDSNKHQIGETGEHDAGAPGANLDYRFVGQPNTTYYIQVWGLRGSVGTYALTVKHQDT